MKIKFIGVGAAFAKSDYFHSNMLVTAKNGKRLLVDCGCDARFSLKEAGVCPDEITNELDAVFISHLHSDHIGGMEWLAFSTFFLKKQKRLKLYMEKNMMVEMWETSLKGGLAYTGEKEMHLEDYFNTIPLEKDDIFEWEDIKFTLVGMPHIKSKDQVLYSYGLMIKDTQSDKKPIFISSDTIFVPDVLTAIASKTSLLFHDCETTAIRTNVHAHYEELRTLPINIKNKMWLYHYQPDIEYDLIEDGFLGFIKKGQEFNFS